MTEKTKDSCFVYVGTFAKKGVGGGIGICRYQPETGEVSCLKTVRHDIIAGQMFIDKEKGVLYTVDERRESRDTGEIGGRVFAFRIDPDTGDLSEINHQSTFGTMPAYLCPDSTGKYLLACNHSGLEWVTRVVKDAGGKYRMEPVYGDSTLVLYPLAEDGAIEEPCDVRVFPVEGGFTACLHYVQASPDGEFFAMCDRNLNRVYFLSLDGERRRLILRSTLQYPCGTDHKNGHAPRYGCFHPQKKIFYFNSEYKPLITTVAYDGNAGLRTLQVQEAVPAMEGIESRKYSQSDLRVSADGRFLYELFRDVNCICVFALDGETGLPEMIQTLPLEGEGPRGMQFSPDGRFLLVANLDTADITTLAVRDDGTVAATGHRAYGVENPGNLVFYTA